MLLKFTKMHGAGNDFVVLDAMRGPVDLNPAQWRWLADRRFGVGADQILVVGPPVDRGHADFSYRIFNADGGEVEQCGNGARAFARFVRDRGLSSAASIRVETMKGIIVPTIDEDGEVTVDMGVPRCAPDDIPFDASGLDARREGDETLWPLSIDGSGHPSPVDVGVVSMGNPHAVLIVDDVERAPLATLGPLLRGHGRFPEGANAGFVEIVDRHAIRLRVYERGVGETLACGSGACAAVVSCIKRGRIDSPVAVHARGGVLTIAWDGHGSPVRMRGPATFVFDGEVEVPDAEALGRTAVL